MSTCPFQIEEVELVDKKGYLTISLSLVKEGNKILLRKPEGIREWYQSLQVRISMQNIHRRLAFTYSYSVSTNIFKYPVIAISDDLK